MFFFLERIMISYRVTGFDPILSASDLDSGKRLEFLELKLFLKISKKYTYIVVAAKDVTLRRTRDIDFVHF